MQLIGCLVSLKSLDLTGGNVFLISLKLLDLTGGTVCLVSLKSVDLMRGERLSCQFEIT